MSSLLFNIVLEVLATVRQKKKLKAEKNEKKEVCQRLSMFADDILLHKRETKGSTKRPSELKREFGKVTAYKINMKSH